MITTIKEILFSDNTWLLKARLSEYFDSFMLNKTILVTNKSVPNKNRLTVLTPDSLLKEDYTDHILLLDLKPRDYKKYNLSEIIQRSLLSVIFDRKGNISAHKQMLSYNGLKSDFVGDTPRIKNATISFHGKCLDFSANHSIKLKKVLAVISTHNDEDIIGQVLDYLVTQDVDILILENWSSDNTPLIIKDKVKRYPGKIFVEKFPKSGPVQNYLWPDILKYKVNNRISERYEWIIHYDSDEIRMSPWIDKTLGESISFVDSLGFNAVNFTLADFRPIKEGFSKDDDPIKFFQYFELRDTPGCFLQMKAYKNFGQKVDISTTFGHDILFEERKVFPIKFLLKHYPLRSTKSARKKIFVDRKPRYLKSSREKGAHVHYDKYQPEQTFIWDSKDLNLYKNNKYAYEKYIVQFLTGVGIKGFSAKS